MSSNVSNGLELEEPSPGSRDLLLYIAALPIQDSVQTNKKNNSPPYTSDKVVGIIIFNIIHYDSVTLVLRVCIISTQIHI
jgi:hypothetical protein